MLSVAQTPAENSMFTQEVEEYRRACRARYAPAEERKKSDEMDVVVPPPVEAVSPQMATQPVAATDCNTSPALKSSVDSLKKSGRRSSLGKVVSFCSGIFSKKPASPEMAKAKEIERMEREKKEQDFRMARFIAELEYEGRTDEEIQMHLFHLRDQAQFQGPRNDNNSVGEWFKAMHQAFKDEFATRRDSQLTTVHVSAFNPFYAAPSANYVHDIGYSYEDLVALENVPRGVKSLDHLPTLVYEGQELPSCQTTCAVCMHDFEHEEELRSLHCTHHFHKECIDKWLAVGTTCPVCKGDVESDC